ncbi:MAG: hypothetical protein LBC28_02235 [Oscillospiraceae bacterium]|jgi:hypothetical protein|nr:hypothetical protein [Oscillospiraceae bacterium]
MDIKPYMKNFGFGHRDSRHLISERDGALVMTFAPEGGASFMPSAGQGGGGLEICLIYDGQPESYEYSATQSLIEMKAKHGSARIALDAGASALRFEGEGVALRLDAKTASMGVTSLNTGSGVELAIGGGKYIFAPIRGSVKFDDTWLLAQFHSVTPVLDLEPEGGKFELAAYELAADAQPPELTKTLAQCAAESETEFKAFCDGLVRLPAQWDDVFMNIAYLLWFNRKKLPDGKTVIVGNKAQSPDTDARLQTIASLVFTDADTALEMILALPPAEPPVQAIAVLRLLDAGLFARASRETVYDFFNALNASARWWYENRSSHDGRTPFYAYRYETGIASPEVFKAGEPVVSPDLGAYCVLMSEALSRLADLVLDGGETAKWRERSGEQLRALISDTWNGEAFTGVALYTGERSERDPLLSYMPLVLGRRLPVGIVDKLAEDIDGQALRSAMGMLAVAGLRDAGKDELAERLAREALEDARSGGVECPFYGAALLAICNGAAIANGICGNNGG